MERDGKKEAVLVIVERTAMINREAVLVIGDCYDTGRL